MNRKQNHTRVKGFTLMELIIVIAIIGVLLGILMPSMAAYYRRSRLQSANANAKAQRFVSRDRTAADASGFAGVVEIAYFGDTGAAQYAENGNGYVGVDTTTAVSTAAQNVVTAVNRTVSDGPEICWAVYIDNYIVKGAVAAPTRSDVNVGFYSANKQFATTESERRAYSENFGNILARLASGYDGNTTAEPTT